MYYVYTITNKLNSKVYVGKSSNKNRWEKHKTISVGGKEKYPRLFYAIHAAIAKYGSDNFIFKIEEECCHESESFTGERQLIAQLRRRGLSLYNMTDGGEGSTGSKRTKEAKKKMSLAHQKDDYMGGKQKLTVLKVKQIKIILTENKIKMKEIGKMFDVDFQSISAINSGKTWSWVDVEGFVPAKRIPNHKLNVLEVREIKQLLLENNLSYRQISKKFQISIGTIQSIKSGKTWKTISL